MFLSNIACNIQRYTKLGCLFYRSIKQPHSTIPIGNASVQGHTEAGVQRDSLGKIGDHWLSCSFFTNFCCFLSQIETRIRVNSVDLPHHNQRDSHNYVFKYRQKCSIEIANWGILDQLVSDLCSSYSIAMWRWRFPWKISNWVGHTDPQSYQHDRSSSGLFCIMI